MGENIYTLLKAIGIIVLILVAYMSFWILVAVFVTFILYHVIKELNEEDYVGTKGF